MGIYLCDPADETYDLDSHEANAHLILAGLFLVLEIFYTIKSILLLKRNTNIKMNFALICFYCLIHLSLLAAFFYYLGGVLICYNKVIYNLLDNYSDTFGRLLILLLLYRLDLYIDRVNGIGKKVTKLGVFMIVICVTDIITYLVLCIIQAYDESWVEYCALYVTFIYSAITFIFLYIFNGIVKLIERDPKTFKKTQWYTLLVGLLIYLLLRLLAVVFQVLEYREHHKKDEDNQNDRKYWIEVSIIAINMITTIIPCLTAIWFMLQTFSTTERKPSAES